MTSEPSAEEPFREIERYLAARTDSGLLSVETGA